MYSRRNYSFSVRGIFGNVWLAGNFSVSKRDFEVALTLPSTRVLDKILDIRQSTVAKISIRPALVPKYH